MNFSINPFSDRFLKAKNSKSEAIEQQISRNSQGSSQEELQLIDAAQSLYSNQQYNPAASFASNQIAFRNTFSNKFQKISLYREMSFFPEIVEALNWISNEAITADEHGNFVKLIIKKEIPAREEKFIRKTFDYIVNDVLKFDELGWKLFRTWLIESELFVEKILNDDGNRLIGVKMLPATNTYPIYDGNVITKFVQTSKKTNYQQISQNQETSFESNQVCYVHYDDYVISKMDVRGYLEPAIRTWNQYKNLQDSLIIYRLVRAPTRRLWNVEAGRLPPGKAEEFLKHMMVKYKQNYNYNPEKGNVDSSKLFQALTDDYWFIKREGQGTTVDTLDNGGMNLGNLDDINLFKTSLYKSLQIPQSRWEASLNSVTTIGAPGELTRDELQFSKFIGRLRNRFKKLFIDLMCTQLELSNQVDSKYRRASLFNVEYCEENLFAEQKKLLNMKSKAEVIAMFRSDMATKDNPDGLWSKKFIMREIYGFTEEEYQNMQNEIQEEISEQKAKEPSDETVPGPGEEEEESPEISQTQNQENQEKNAEETPTPETPEGSKEQIPGEESGTNQIQLP